MPDPISVSNVCIAANPVSESSEQEIGHRSAGNPPEPIVQSPDPASAAGPTCSPGEELALPKDEIALTRWLQTQSMNYMWAVDPKGEMQNQVNLAEAKDTWDQAYQQKYQEYKSALDAAHLSVFNFSPLEYGLDPAATLARASLPARPIGGVGEQLQALEAIAGVFAMGEGEIPAGIAAEPTLAAEPLRADVATPKIIQGSSSLVSAAKEFVTSDGTFAMANRTGYEPTPLGKGALAGTDEITLVAHGNANQVALGNKALSPQKLANELVAAGWKGGTVRLAVCQTGIGGDSSYGQQLANALDARRATSVVIAPEGSVNLLSDEHGLPQVRGVGESSLAPPGKGWQFYTPK